MDTPKIKQELEPVPVVTVKTPKQVRLFENLRSCVILCAHHSSRPTPWRSLLCTGASVRRESRYVPRHAPQRSGAPLPAWAPHVRRPHWTTTLPHSPLAPFRLCVFVVSSTRKFTVGCACVTRVWCRPVRIHAGMAKAVLPWWEGLLLSFMAGMYISAGASFSVIIAGGAPELASTNGT